METLKLRTGDKVKVLQGKDRGKEGSISKVLASKNQVIVDGVNIVKKHQRAGQTRRGNNTQMIQGGIIDREMPIDASSVAIVCSKDGATRVGYKFEGEGANRKKIRICRKCGGEL